MNPNNVTTAARNNTSDVQPTLSPCVECLVVAYPAMTHKIVARAAAGNASSRAR
jgi:hypothetical protein